MTLLLTQPQRQILQQNGLTARCQLSCGCVLLEGDVVIYPHGECRTLVEHDAWLAEAQNQNGKVKHK